MDVQDAIMSIWTKISEECFQHLVESMPQKIKAVPNKGANECIYIYIYMCMYTHTLTGHFIKVYLIKWPVSVYIQYLTLFTTKEHFWTLDSATLTWFRTLYPQIQRGHWRYFGTPSWTKATWIIPGGEGNTAGDVLESATDWGKGLTVLLYRVFCSLMSNPWRIRWTILEPGLVSNGTLGTVTSFVWLKHGSRPRSRTLR